MVENLKVFELAKEMGIETIALMDKLREFKIPVRSHMAELDVNLIQTIKARFEEEKAKSTSKTKATRTKKAGAAAAPPKAPRVAKSTKVSTVVKPKAKAAAAPAVTAPSVSRTVIRRKANAPEAVQAPESDSALAQGSELSQAPSDEMETDAIHEPVESAESPKPKEVKGVRTAQVLSRMDLRTTMGERAPKMPGGSTPGPTTEKAVADARAASHAALEANKFDREAIGKLIKQEALAQARKAAALLRETKIETFNAADFRKRELLFQPKKKKTLTGRAAQKTQITTPSAAKRRIRIEGEIKVSDLAKQMGIKTNAVLRQLTAMGSPMTADDNLDFDTAQVIAAEYKFELENVALSEDQMIAQNKEAVTDQKMVPRPPVVTVMGHVDHGKTSLLDAIRQSNVAKGEAGGITQHIGAYSVDFEGKKITFLDTPGHEAFTAMRARGAKVTDIVILVVAADDGIMPQTKEAVVHAKAAGVPIIVAVNKMDLPGANPQKVLQGLTEFELVPEEWGGTTIVAKVSATKKEGIKELLEMILLQAEVLELRVNPNQPASGTVIEARVDRGRGTVATLLIQQGTARLGDAVVAGSSYGRIRAMVNDKGQSVKVGHPGDPLEILGLNAVPNAGDTFDVVNDEGVAKEIAEKRLEKSKSGSGPAMKMSLEELFAKVQVSDVKELPVIIKADVQGSAEALKDMLGKIPADKVKVKVLSATVGGISESDVLFASASKAVIIGFNVRPETGVSAIAEREGVEIKAYTIIYDVVDDVKKAMTGMLSPTFVEKALGRAEVRSLFNVSKVGTIAGCSVLDGKITRQSQVRLLRDSRVVYEGRLSSLKRFKDDVKEVLNGYECGIGIENYNDLKVGDVIEAYVKEQVATLLN